MVTEVKKGVQSLSHKYRERKKWRFVLDENQLPIRFDLSSESGTAERDDQGLWI